MKAHELARELGISQKELVNFLQQRRLTRNTAAPLAPGAIEAARSAFKPATMTKIETNGDRRAVLPPTLSVKDLAEKLSVSPVEVIKKLMAYKIETADGHPVVFIDTPGHEAFTAMRARGAQVTDLVVLVVAADDGVMPQTVEAIHHARAAKVPIIVAINKIDKDNANPDRVHQQLAEQGIVTRHYGGEHECVHLSARTGKGIDDLLTTIVLSSDILELKANPNRNAIGTIVDAHLERGRGPVATVLVQAGTLKVGDDFVCGHIYGRVRALADDRGRNVTEAPPATPVVVSGMSEVPQAGDIFQVVGSEKAARQIALTKLTEKRTQEAARDVAPRITLEDLARRAKEGEVKELSLVAT